MQAGYDDVTQELFSELGDEKKEQYFDAYPDREREYDGDKHAPSYDRYAGFIMDMKLNKIAQSRLAAAMEKGYADGRVTGEGTVVGRTGIDPLSQKCYPAWRCMSAGL